MKDIVSFVVLLRIFYSGALLFIAIVLMREVWFVWFDRQMTFGEIKYFDGTKVEQGAADRFRHLLNQEYNHVLGYIRDYRQIRDAISARGSITSNIFEAESLEPAILAFASRLESFERKERDFVSLDVSFQGVDVKKLFSSVRTYLSPSVDLNILVTKNSSEDIRANIRWPREGRPLEGLVKRYLDYEIGPLKEDVVLARKVSCYLLWLQFFNGQTNDLASLHEFCLWIDGLKMLRALADAKSNLTVNSAPQGTEILSAAEQFAPGFTAEFDYVDNYRVAAFLLSEAVRRDSLFKPQVPVGDRKARIDPTFLASLLNYYYVHLVLNLERREFFREASEQFKAGAGEDVNPEVVGRKLLANRVVPWSKISERLTPTDARHEQAAGSEGIILERSEQFHSGDIGSFGFPKREVSSILRDIGPNGQWQGTAFLVAPDIALTSSIARRRPDVGGAHARGYVEYVLGPYEPAGVKFQRVAVKEVIPLISASVGVVALKLETPIPAAVPFKIAPSTVTRRRSGQAIYLLSYLANVVKEKSSLDAVFNGEFERPIYLGGTILLQNDTGTETQYAYDAFTLPGSAGSPVVEAASGEVIAIHHSGTPFSGGIMKIARGLDITSLSSNAILKGLIAGAERARTSPGELTRIEAPSDGR